MEVQKEFSFERLEVYRRGLAFVKEIFNLTSKFPKIFQFSLGDQLRRAALSIINNLAEGSDRISKRERKKFYEYALCSARECIPMLSLSGAQGLINDSELAKLRNDCIIICKMLRKLIQSIS